VKKKIKSSLTILIFINTNKAVFFFCFCFFQVWNINHLFKIKGRSHCGSDSTGLSILFPFTTSLLDLHLDSRPFQFPLALPTCFRISRKTVVTWNEKKKLRGIYRQNKSTWPPFIPACKNMEICSSTATHPSHIRSFETLWTSQKSYRIQYITFCFTSLELQNERVGVGIRNKNL